MRSLVLEEREMETATFVLFRDLTITASHTWNAPATLLSAPTVKISG